jgi:hypothetical protein
MLSVMTTPALLVVTAGITSLFPHATSCFNTHLKPLRSCVHFVYIRTERFDAKCSDDLLSLLSSPWWWRQHVPLKRRSTIILHGSTSQKTNLNLILAAARTWNLALIKWLVTVVTTCYVTPFRFLMKWLSTKHSLHCALPVAGTMPRIGGPGLHPYSYGNLQGGVHDHKCQNEPVILR